MGRSSAPPTDGPARPRPRWRRRLRRLTFVFGFLAVVSSVGLAWLWHRRTEVVSDLLSRAFDPWSATVAHVDVDLGSRFVELRDLRIRPTPDGADWLHIARIRLSGTVGGLRRGHADRVDVDGVVVEIDAESFERLTAAGSGGTRGAVPSISLGEVNVRDVRVTVALPEGAAIKGTLDYSGAGISSTGGVWSLSRQVAQIHEASVLSNDAIAASTSDLEVEFSFDGARRALVVHRLAAPTLKAHVTPDLLASIAGNRAEGIDPPFPTEAAATLRRFPLAAVALAEAQIESIDFRLDGFQGIPSTSFRARWQGSGVRWDGDWLIESQTINFADARLAWSGDAGTPFLTAPAIGVRFSFDEASGLKINRLDLDNPAISLRPEDLKRFQTNGKQVPVADAGPAAGGPLVVVESMSVTAARFTMSGFGEGDYRLVPNARAGFDAAVEKLTIGRDGRVASNAVQRLDLRDGEAGFPDQPVFARLRSAEVELIPDDLLARRIVRTVKLSGPDFGISSEFLMRFNDGSALNASDASKDASTTVQPGDPPARTFSWAGVRAQNLTIDDGRLTIRQFDPSVPEVRARLGVTTLADGPTYKVILTDVTVHAPAADPEIATFARAPAIVATVHSERLWQSLIDSVTIENGEVEIGKAVQTLVPRESSAATPPSAQTPKDAGAGPGQPGWRIGQLSVNRFRVTVADVVPLLDPAAFEVTWSVSNLPLTPAGLAAQTAPQRVELNDIQLHAAQNTGPVPVADFPTVFVEFSLAGLIDQRIDGVELISPVIYVGEQLFWYVEHFRKRSALQTEAGSPNSGEPNAGAPANAGWSVGRIDAHLGKMLLALKGSVIDSLPPLPFSCSTQIDEGRLDLVLEFPRGTYRPSSRVALELDIEEGSASFNLPLKQRSNNLVQVFKVSELRYGQGQPFRVRNAFMTVTFDKDGVYGKLGGELYGGYASGGFDVYLDDNTSWDCWIAGDNIDMKPVTDILTPEYLKVDGPLKFKLIAFGDLESLYTANGDLSIVRPGNLALACLDGLRDSFPDDWARLETSLSTTGIDTLRDFPFDHCRGTFEIFGKEGNLAVDMAGPHGTRAVKVEVHNHTAGATQSIEDTRP